MIVSVIFCGCSLLKKPDYFPLSKGSEWTYLYEGVDVIYKVIDAEPVDGKACSVIQTTMNGKIAQKLYFIKTDKELLEVIKLTIGGLKTRYNPSQPLMKFPVKIGDSWRWKGDLGNNNNADLNSKVIHKEKISTPAGIFDTIKIETEGTVNNNIPAKMEMWFAPNVGLVKEIFQYGPRKVSLLLKSYKIVK